MMNRRDFIKTTMALAAAATLPTFALAENALIVPPPPPRRWVPTPEEVANWLEYYKAWVGGLRPDIHDIVPTKAEGYSGVIDEDPETMLVRFKAFEDAFQSQEADRLQVGREFLAGYDAGKAGLERYCARFDRPSNASYAWYNYWQVGDFDRRYARGDRAARLEAASWRSPAPGKSRTNLYE